MRKVLVILLVCAGAASFLRAQVRVGQKAPELNYGPALQGEKHLPRPGHVLLVESWATWCGYCVDSIPQLNTLQAQFASQGIDFLWLSSEPAPTIQAFLKAHPMRGTVAQDVDFTVSKAFDMRGYPTTVLIDSSGNVAAITRTEDVNAAVLTALLQHQTLPLTPSEIDYHLAETHSLFAEKGVAASDALVRVMVWRVEKQGGINYPDDEWKSDGTNLRMLLALAYNLSPYQIDMPAYLDENYAVQAWVPDRASQTLKPLMQASLNAAAEIKVHHEQHYLDVLVLSGLPGALKTAPVTDFVQGGSPKPGIIDWKNASADSIRSSIESQVGKMVVLDHAISGRFVFNVTWNAKAPNALQKALELQGLKLTLAKRNMDVLVVESLISSTNKP